MELYLGTNWTISRALPDSSLDLCIFDDMCMEERWFKTFANVIQPHHELQTLIVQFDWPELSISRRWANNMITRIEDQNTLSFWRERLLNFLNDHVRGIRKNSLCRYTPRTDISDTQLTGISMAMTRNRKTAIERDPKRVLTLSEALLNVKMGA